MFGIKAEKRDELIIYLKSKRIATDCHYTPLNLQPLFKPYANNCDYIEKEANKLITLPLHADLTNVEIEYMFNELIKFEINK